MNATLNIFKKKMGSKYTKSSQMTATERKKKGIRKRPVTKGLKEGLGEHSVKMRDTGGHYWMDVRNRGQRC